MHDQGTAHSSRRTQREILAGIASPADLKRLSIPDLTNLAAEIREELIEVVTRNGGHLGASLGTVELTLALHYVFDSPRDKLVWDVGHQAYIHKLLTGRRDRFPTIRQEGGISGFLSRDESEHDAFGAGHASTSISAALGMAVAESMKPDGEERGRAVAIIGDGALTGGMAFEGLNNAGNLRRAHDRRPQRQRDVDRPERRRDLEVPRPACAPTRATPAPRHESRSMIASKLPQGELLVELGKRMERLRSRSSSTTP